MVSRFGCESADAHILTKTGVVPSIARFGSYHDGMCSHYQAIKERERYLRHFGVEPPADIGKKRCLACLA